MTDLKGQIDKTDLTRRIKQGAHHAGVGPNFEPRRIQQRMRAAPPPCLSSHAWKVRLPAFFGEGISHCAFCVKVRIVTLAETRWQMHVGLEFI